MEKIRDLLLKETSGSDILLNEPMSLHTSFRTGGPADLFIDAAIQDLPIIFSVLNEEVKQVAIIGNGSNILVGDKGIRGAVVCLGKNAKGVFVNENEIVAKAGELLSVVSKEAAKASLSGLEFASGIPGSIGGGVFMNAGAYDGELADCITGVSGVDKNGNILNYSLKDCEFGYRKSIFQNGDIIITEVRMKLTEGDSESIYNKMEDFSLRRKTRQPLEYPSAGSTFKRPEGNFAGKLIEDAGLKGFALGGAMVSDKHAGFVINYKDATSKDIVELIETVQKRVLENSGIGLDLEVRLVGEF